ncbi:hypothetical protein KCU91_g1044, partial [Aureobasidium melanogenum]
MAAPATTAAPATGWDDLPAELHEQVVNHLRDHRVSLENVIASDGPATHEALRLYWSIATPENDLFTILENKPFHHQQFFVNFLRRITIEFKAPGEHPEGRGIQYPRLQSLTVVHDQVLMGRESRTYARIRRFINAGLRYLEVGWHLHEAMGVTPTTDNFLPALSGCSDIRPLALRARVEGATSDDLVDVLNNCIRLRSLNLEKYTECLIDESTIQAIAAHPGIRFLQIDKHLDVQLLSLVANISRPFEHAPLNKIQALPNTSSLTWRSSRGWSSPSPATTARQASSLTSASSRTSSRYSSSFTIRSSETKTWPILLP